MSKPMRTQETPAELAYTAHTTGGFMKVVAHTHMDIDTAALETDLLTNYGNAIAGVDVHEVCPPVIVIRMMPDASEQKVQSVVEHVQRAEHITRVTASRVGADTRYEWESRNADADSALYESLRCTYADQESLVAILRLRNETSRATIQLPRQGDLLKVRGKMHDIRRIYFETPSLHLAPGQVEEIECVYLPTRYRRYDAALPSDVVAWAQAS